MDGRQRNGHTIRRLTRNEIIAEIDQGAQARLGLSGEALIREYKNGTLEDACEVSDLLILAGLLPKRDSLFVPF